MTPKQCVIAGFEPCTLHTRIRNCKTATPYKTSNNNNNNNNNKQRRTRLEEAELRSPTFTVAIL